MSLSFDMCSIQIADFFHRATEASWTDHGAIRARQAALGDVIPTRMLQLGEQCLADVGGVQMPLDLIGGLLSRGMCGS